MIPDKIKVGGMVYTIEQTEENICVNGKESLGSINFENCVIKLNTNRAERRVEQTFWHELIHAIFIDRRIELPEGMDEEYLVDTLAIALHQIVVDNDIKFGGMNDG